ncbi:hypothetical protein ACOJQI_09670 [Bacillus salacetis]|uniref:hypothetical protein n=1 Tax=Bacillus salacetis TaxID=2315464 RepID=UPI003B9EEDDB
MKKWIFSAVLYLIIVITAYSIYDQFAEGENIERQAHGESHAENTEGENHNHNDGSHEHDGTGEWWANIVETEVKVDNENLNITIKDSAGEYVEELEINHEKLLHLIVVTTDLETYKHLHPEQTGPGQFRVKHDLPEGAYKAFIDIKPKEMNYEVQPISFKIAEGSGKPANLQESKNLTVEQSGHAVTLQPSSQKVNEEVVLEFDLDGETPEPYLGALGHVVILDEKAEEYIHVHPGEGDKPVFLTEFQKPGLYKVWAEFKFEGEVFTFPYVLKIEE